MAKMGILNISMPDVLRNKIKREAKRKNISIAAFVRMIASEYFEKH